MANHLIPPHGGNLVNLIVDEDRAAALKDESRDWPSHDLTPRHCATSSCCSTAASPRLPDSWLGTITSACARRCVSPTARSGRCRSRWTFPKSWPRRSRRERAWRCRRCRGRHGGGAAGRGRLAARPAGRGRGGLRLHEPGAPGRGAPPRADAAVLCRRHADRRAARGALRLPAAAALAAGAAGRVRQAWMDARRSVPDAQPDAPGASGADAARGEGGRSQPVDSSRGRHDEARRRRPLHARSLLSGAAAPLSEPDRAAVAPAARNADGRPSRGGMARDHPQELRLHASHRRPRPRRTGQRLGGHAVLRSVRRPGAAAPARSRARRRDGAVPDDGLRRGQRLVRTRGRGPRGDPHAEPLGHGAAQAAGREQGCPGLVHVPRGREGAAEEPPAAAHGRGSPSSSPACPDRASRPSPTCCSSSSSRWEGGP